LVSRGRPSGEKTRCSGQWTEAKFRSFIKGNLRSATRKWAPIQQCRKNAHRARGVYECAGCHQLVPPTIYDEDKKKRVKNICVDHIVPTVDPETGFMSWDQVIEGLFCELDNLQLLCKACHDGKTSEETEVAKLRRTKEKQNEE
jgi:5-methylcytosine-specific restriction endonuclease McrA